MVVVVQTETLKSIVPGMQLLVGGNRMVAVPEELAVQFSEGDSLVYVEDAGELLLIPKQQAEVAAAAVARARAAFRQMPTIGDAEVNRFYERFAALLEDDAIWRSIAEANRQDVADAKKRGRSTTRLEATERLRTNMVSGLRGWAKAPATRGKVLETVQHDGWAVDLVASELGVVAFVFEGRPNVLADATGVLKGGNTVVYRIGRDALGTARAIMKLALEPALKEAGLPEGAVCLLDSSAHAAGWALFRNRDVALAVARGSGRAVDVLGSLARQSGVAVSLHGTGGAWLVASSDTQPEHLQRVVFDSLDRKVCNTLNVCCIPQGQASSLVPAFLEGLSQAAKRRNVEFKLHVVRGDEPAVAAELFERKVLIGRAEGPVEEPQASVLEESDLGREWEWEDSPEVTLKIVDSVDHAVDLCNRYSPQFVACLLSQDEQEQSRFFDRVNTPFVGDGFTRWVDGQVALKRPELGLSNWEKGRMLARAGVLSGDSIYTVRTRARGTAPR